MLFFLCWLMANGNQQLIMLGILAWMLIWWISSALPIGVTALIPIVLFPLCGILDLQSTTANYANPVIYLFFGGFVLGLAIEKWHLHKRIALNIIRLTGEAPNRIILGSMLATALLSSIISNTATTVMMLPIGMSVVSLLGSKLEGKDARNFAITLMLGIAYAANIGGMATLIGTPPNLVLAGLTREAGLAELGFAQWMLFAAPLVLVLFLMVYLINTRLVFRVKIKALAGIKELIGSELKSLGKMNTGEKRTVLVVSLTALLWIFRAQLQKIGLLANLSDTVIAIAAAIALFSLPAGRNESEKRILDWADTKKLPWGILLLFGGGISLARGMEETEIVNLIADWIASGSYAWPILIVLLVTFFAVFLTEVMSNVALVSVFIPVAFVIASKLGLDEMSLAIPLTLGASCAFMFPISTPPNAIVYSSGYIKMNEMAKTGILLNIICILVITVYSYFAGPLFFGN